MAGERMSGDIKNPLSEQQWSKLKASMVWSDRQIEFQKRKRIQAIRDLVGYHYADFGSFHRQPVPMLALAVQIYVRMLASGNPRALVTTKKAELKPTAANLELALNQIPEEIDLQATLRRAVMEALFSIGVVKVGLHEVGTILGHSYGQPFVDVIPLDDYFLDMTAKNMDQIDYEGNTYWMDYTEIMESDWLTDKARECLKPDEYTTVGPAGENRAEQVSADSSADQYRDRVWLRDVWMPKEQVILTMGNQTQTLLKVTEWKGPTAGPYPKLSYIDVPGNLLPLPPVQLWRDLHEISNKLFRKLADEAESSKSVMGFQGGDEESVNNFKAAHDGEGIRYTGADPKLLTTPGVDQKTMAFYLQCRDLFSYYAGNLDSLGGLGQQSETLGQDKLLGAAASSQMKDMYDRTASFIKEIFYSLAWYEWHDPVKKRELQKPVPGTELVIPVQWNQKSKKGKFDLYDIDMDIYSLQDNSPNVRLQKLQAIMKAFIVPFVDQIKQAGGTIDVQKILQLVGKYSDFPELDEIVTFVEGNANTQQGGSSSPPPARGDSTVTRVGQPGMSRAGGERQMAQTLMGQGVTDNATEGVRTAR